VVVVNFIYTTCVFPQFCYRMTNHFNVLQKRFAKQMGRPRAADGQLRSGARLRPSGSRSTRASGRPTRASGDFLTGSVEDVRRVCAAFGVDFFPDEGLITHSIHTAVIDSHGRAAGQHRRQSADRRPAGRSWWGGLALLRAAEAARY
jgi:cytochrome oxidase Cu insertion factor (SCO1/SenC/PrrC family)